MTNGMRPYERFLGKGGAGGDTALSASQYMRINEDFYR